MLKVYVTTPDPKDLVEKVQKDFPEKGILEDREMKFYDHLIPKLESLEEFCTVRFGVGKVRIPYGPNGELPWIETKPHDSYHRKELGIIKIPMIVLAHLPDFPEGLAMLDEYSSKQEMIEDLENIYDVKVVDTDILSAYLIGELIRH